MTPSQDEFTGTLIAERYQVGGCIRRSDLQRLYKALDVNTGANVHLRILYPSAKTDDQFRIGFKRQVARISSIAHPNVLVPSDFGFTNDLPFIVTPSFAGVSLRDELQLDGRFKIERVIDIAEQIADALGAGHAAGVVHGNISSHTIVLVGGFSETEQAYVLDFGLSHLFTADDSGSAMTDSGKLIGDPEYLAPEQIRGLPIGVATDIYSLGIVLYELLTGSVPFKQTIPGAEGVMDLLVQQANDPVPAIDPELGIDAQLEAALVAALAKDANQRPETVAMFVRRLAEAGLGVPGDFSLPPSSESDMLFAPGVNDFIHTPQEHLSQTEDRGPLSPFDSLFSRDESQSPSATPSPYELAPEYSPQNQGALPDEDEPLSEKVTATDILIEQAARDEQANPAAFDWLQSIREEQLPRNQGVAEPFQPVQASSDTSFAASEFKAQDEEFPTFDEDLLSLQLESGQHKDHSAPSRPELFTPADTPQDDWQHHGKRAPKAKKPKKKLQNRSAATNTTKRGILIRLTQAVIGIGVVAAIVLVVGLNLKKTQPSSDSSTEPGEAFTTDDSLVDTQVAIDDNSPLEPAIANDVQDIPQESSASVADTAPRYAKVNLESIILESTMGKRLAAEYEKAFRAVANRPNKAALMEELHSRMTQAVGEIRQDLEAVVVQYATREGYELVVRTDNNDIPQETLFAVQGADSTSLPADSSLVTDISQEILTTYNQQVGEQ